MTATSAKLDIVILAAGKGTRMKSALPKVLHCVGGKPMLHRVIDTAQKLNPQGIHVVVGHGGAEVRASLADRRGINFVEQREQLGTGHAVQQVSDHLSADSEVLILYGDVPLIQVSTLQRTLAAAQKGFGLLTQTLEDPTGYGRIVRASGGEITEIVEQKDASPEQLKISEINTGVMALPASSLMKWVPLLSNANAQKEYYLTDLIAIAASEQVAIESAEPDYAWEPQGVNNRLQQAELERHLQSFNASTLMSEGLQLADPGRFDLRGSLKVGSDCSIDVNCIIEGDVVLEDRVEIGAGCILRDCKIGKNTKIAAYSLVDSSTIGEDATIGPFARLRPGSQLADHTKIGNFVETKKAIIGEGSKVNHLSYVGDTKMGAGVNVGAGSITCNYDGVNKHLTEIEDGAFIGSNSALVAPVKVGKNATIGAGSTISRPAPDDALTLSRAKQTTLPDWKRPKKTP